MLPEWWPLFTLVFSWPSFCNSKCYCQYFHFWIHSSVSTEFWTRACWYCQPLLNEKEFKIAIVVNLVCRGVHRYWDDVMIPEKKKTAPFWLSKLNNGLAKKKNRRHFSTPPTASLGNDVWPERRNSIPMARHYQDLSTDSDWSCRVWNLLQPIRSTTQIWVVRRHQYGISALISQTSFRGETVGGVAKCRLYLFRRMMDLL